MRLTIAGKNDKRFLFEDLTGRLFGKFRVIEHFDRHSSGHRWKCKCICGTIRIICSDHLRSGKRTGCKSCNNGIKLRPFESLFNKLVYFSKKRGINITLSYEDYCTFATVNNCHYCGKSIIWKKHSPERKGHNLDRKDNSLGYTLDNCVVCCPRCNWSKSNDFTYDEWVLIGNLIRSWKK